jgi:hypothetical protein
MKIEYFLALVIALLTGAIAGPIILAQHTRQLGGASVLNANYYNTATNTSVVCSGATSTLVLAAATRPDTRFSFNVTAVSSTVALCRGASNCALNNGIVLTASATTNIAERFEQSDAYYGAYSCIGNAGASSTISISYSQT